MKILFVDIIDIVSKGFYGFDHDDIGEFIMIESVKLIKKVIEKTGAYIVIFVPDEYSKCADSIKGALSEFEIDSDKILPLIYFQKIEEKSWEILSLLSSTKVDSFVIFGRECCIPMLSHRFVKITEGVFLPNYSPFISGALSVKWDPVGIIF